MDETHTAIVADFGLAKALNDLDAGANYTLSALWRRDARPGPATSWLIDAIRDRLGECSGLDLSAPVGT